MHRKALLMLLLLAGLGAAGLVSWLAWPRSSPHTPQPQPTSRPNVLLVSLDTLRPDHLGCYGYPRPTSPNLDRFAAHGIRFSNCRAQATWTLPSHMSLFTSMLPSHNGVDNLNKVLPEEVPTLARLLRDEGYRTAALVNNGQMRAHWGFSRGFDTWREFEVDTPAGNCEAITAEAVDWLRSAREAEPFFLFLHYYDTHDPYAAPESYRQKMGTMLTGPEARTLCFRHRFPDRPLARARLDDLLSAYDAEIAWLDHELGKLLDAVPPNTLVVIFSDHGEAFKEHGWTLHGASLYEEEVRVPLLLRLPDKTAQPAVIGESVMLLDVAPTILARCGIRPPLSFQGKDLCPLWDGRGLRPRLVPAESKAVLEGRLSLSVVLFPLKAIYSPLEGRFELYRLPDEQKSLAETDRAAAEALFKPLRGWMEGEQFWLIHAAGEGDYEATIALPEGRFGLFIPVGLDEARDRFEVLDEGRALRWHVYPARADRPKALFLQPADPASALRVDLRINGERSREAVFIGKEGKHPDALPALVKADVAPVSPVIEKPFKAERPGFYVFFHQAEGSRTRPGQVAPLDEQTLWQLRSLGYLQ